MNHTDFVVGQVYLLKLKTGLCKFGLLEWVLPQHNVGYIGGIFHAFETGIVQFAEVTSMTAFDGYAPYETYDMWTERIGLRGLAAF